MFAKLLKHEFRAQKKIFFFLSIAALVVGLLGGLLLWYIIHCSQSDMPQAAEVIGMTFGVFGFMGVVLALVAFGIATTIILLMRFYRHHFTGEGYLTFTLPATTHQILLASIVNIIIWTVITGIVLFLSVCMIFLPAMIMTAQEASFDIETLKYAFQGITIVFEELEIGVFPYILSLISSFIYSLTLPLLCITIGSIVAKKHKLLASFGIYYGISLAISTLSGVMNVAITLADTISQMRSSLVFSTVMQAVLQLCIGIGSYCLMHHLISKKLNLQ